MMLTEATPAGMDDPGIAGDRWLMVGFAALYLALPTRCYNGDGLALIQRLRQTEWWENFDPNHFLWAALPEGCLAAARILGLPTDPRWELGVLQALLALVSLGTLWVVLQWSRELGFRVAEARAIAGFVGVSFTFWHYATDVSMYPLMMLLNILAVREIWRFRLWGDVRHLVGSAVWLALAILVHQLSVLTMVTIWGALAGASGMAGRWRVAGLHLLVVSLLVGMPYVYVAEVLYRETAVGGLRQYLLDPNSAGRGGDWAPFKFGRAVDTWGWAAMVGHWQLSWYADDRELYQGFTKPGGQALFDRTAPRLGPLVWAYLCLMGLVVLLAWPRVRARSPLTSTLHPLLVWWLMPPVVFTTFALNPGWAYYKLLYLAPMGMLGGLLVRHWGTRPVYGVLAVMGAWNLLVGIGPASVAGHEPRYAQAMAWRGALTPEDLVITDNDLSPIFIQYLRALTGAQRIVYGEVRPAFPALGRDREAFAQVSDATLQQFYRRIFIDLTLEARLRAAGGLALSIQVLPDYAPRDLVLRASDWESGAVLDGTSRVGVSLVELRRRPNIASAGRELRGDPTSR